MTRPPFCKQENWGSKERKSLAQDHTGGGKWKKSWDLDLGLSEPSSDIQNTQQLVGHGADSADGRWTQGSLGPRGRVEWPGQCRQWAPDGAREAALHQGEWKYFTIKQCGCTCLSRSDLTALTHPTCSMSC